MEKRHISVRPIAERIAEYSIPEPNSGCVLWAGPIDARGYGKLHIRRTSPKLAHRLVAELAGMKIDGKCVCHHCDTPACVNPNHFFVGTHADNMQDMQRKGRHGIVRHREKWKRGADHGQAKLTADDVKKIRHLAGKMSQRKIAAQFGVSQRLIFYVIHREGWRHV